MRRIGYSPEDTIRAMREGGDAFAGAIPRLDHALNPYANATRLGNVGGAIADRAGVVADRVGGGMAQLGMNAESAYSKFKNAVQPYMPDPQDRIPYLGTTFGEYGIGATDPTANQDGFFAKAGFDPGEEFEISEEQFQEMIQRAAPGSKLNGEQLLRLAKIVEEGGRDAIPAIKQQYDAWQDGTGGEDLGYAEGQVGGPDLGYESRVGGPGGTSMAYAQQGQASGPEQTPEQISAFMNPLLQGLAQDSPGLIPDQAAARPASNVFTPGFGDEELGVGQMVGRGLLAPVTLLDGVINGNDFFPGLIGGLGIGKEARRRREVLDAEFQADQARKNMSAGLQARGAQLPGTAEARAEHQQQAMLASAVNGYDGQGSGGIAMARPGVTTSETPTIQQAFSEMFLQTYADRRAEADAEIRARKAEIGQYGRITAVSDSLATQSVNAQASRQAEQTLQQRVRANDISARNSDLSAQSAANSAQSAAANLSLRSEELNLQKRKFDEDVEFKNQKRELDQERLNWTRMSNQLTALQKRRQEVESRADKLAAHRRQAVTEMRQNKNINLRRMLAEDNGIGLSMVDHTWPFDNALEPDGTSTGGSDSRLLARIDEAISTTQKRMAEMASAGGMEVTKSSDDDDDGDDGDLSNSGDEDGEGLDYANMKVAELLRRHEEGDTAASEELRANHNYYDAD